MPTLKFSIIGQDIVAEPFKEKIVANSVNYLEVEFSFEKASSDWDGLDKFAEFTYDRKSYIAELQTQLKFYVPWQVIKIPGFSVSVFGRKRTASGNETIVSKQITTELIPIKVYPSGNLEGLFADEETNEVYIAVAEEALDNSEKALKLATDSAAKVDKLRIDIDNLSNDILAAVNLADDFGAFVKKVDNTLERQDREVIELQKNVDEHSKRLTNINDELLSIKEDLKILSGEDQRLHDFITELQDVVEKNMINLRKLSESIQNISNTLQQQEIKINSFENNFQQIDVKLEELNNTDISFSQRLEKIKADITDLQFNNKKLISKEDTDFIFYTNLNLISDFYEGSLNLQDGTEVQSTEYKYSNYIENSSSIFTTNYSTFDLCFYRKVESEQTDQETLAETILTSYDFVSSTTVTDFTINKEDENLCFRVSVPIEVSDYFNLQVGDTYQEESSYYKFDYSLENAIYKLIDEKVGVIINADY